MTSKTPTVDAAEVIDIRQAATRLGKSIRTLRRWDHEGRLKAAGRGARNARVYRTDEIERLRLAEPMPTTPTTQDVIRRLWAQTAQRGMAGVLAAKALAAILQQRENGATTSEPYDLDAAMNALAANTD